MALLLLRGREMEEEVATETLKEGELFSCLLLTFSFDLFLFSIVIRNVTF